MDRSALARPETLGTVTYRECDIRGADIANILDATFAPAIRSFFPDDTHVVYRPRPRGMVLGRTPFASGVNTTRKVKTTKLTCRGRSTLSEHPESHKDRETAALSINWEMVVAKLMNYRQGLMRASSISG